MSVIKITNENFDEEVVNSSTPVIVDFYADWCGPCKMMSPVIDQIADELGTTVKVGKVNSDEDIDLAQKFGIMSIPTIILFENGNEIKRHTGFMSKEEFINFLN